MDGTILQRNSTIGPETGLTRALNQLTILET
jgi:hypothetical protein